MKKAGWATGDDIPHSAQPVPCEDKWFPFPGQIHFFFYFKSELLPLNTLQNYSKTKQNPNSNQTLGTGLPYSLTALAFCGKEIIQVIKYFVLKQAICNCEAGKAATARVHPQAPFEKNKPCFLCFSTFSSGKAADM